MAAAILNLAANKNQASFCSIENNERNRKMRLNLQKFREDIESLKKLDVDSDYDRIHASNVQFGIDKYSALRRVNKKNSLIIFQTKIFLLERRWATKATGRRV